MGDFLGEDIALVQTNNLYRCLDKLTAHKQAMFTFLGERWKDLFQADFEVLLYDLTSTYFRCDPPRAMASGSSATAATSVPIACKS